MIEMTKMEKQSKVSLQRIQLPSVRVVESVFFICTAEGTDGIEFSQLSSNKSYW